MAEGSGGRPVCGCGLPVRSLGLCLWHYSAARRAGLDPLTEQEQILKLGIHPGKYRQYPGWERQILQETIQELLSRLDSLEATETRQRGQLEQLSRQHLEDTRLLRRRETELDQTSAELERERERGLILESQLRICKSGTQVKPPSYAALEEENRLLRRKLNAQRAK